MSFHGRSLRLLRRYLDYVGLVQVERHQLVAIVHPEINLDSIDIGAPSPVLFIGNDYQLLSGLPIRNLKRPCAPDSLGSSAHNRVAGLRQVRGKRRIGGWQGYCDRVIAGVHGPTGICRAQPRRYERRSQRRAVVEPHATTYPETPFLISGFGLPGGRETWLFSSEIVQHDQRVE